MLVSIYYCVYANTNESRSKQYLKTFFDNEKITIKSRIWRLDETKQKENSQIETQLQEFRQKKLAIHKLCYNLFILNRVQVFKHS